MIKRFSIQIVVRIILIVGCSLGLAFFFMHQNWFSLVAMAILILAQVVMLIEYVNNTNYTLVKFLDALKNKDFSVYFSPTDKGNSFAALFNDFNEIIRLFKQNKIDKEAQLKYFNQILEQIGLGIISIKKSDLLNDNTEDEILFLNRAACDLLDIPKHKYWHRVVQHLPWFKQQLISIANGGKTLVTIGKELEHQQLAIEVVNIELLNVPYLIISLQDIHNEIEQKEMEAWHNIISVLAHEMMNSFTPISSLTATLRSLTENEQGEVIDISEMDNEAIKDINLGMKTIQKRSEGLMDFVSDYRKVSNVPVPDLKPTLLKDFLEDIDRLMRPVVAKNDIQLDIQPIPSHATILMDTKLIEQVMVNLINNSINALKNRPNPTITIDCTIKPNQIIVSLTDNGCGIPEDVRKNIFVPFYTTRENGSGIGLSLSKSIMKQHKGQIYVQTEEDKFTSFLLVF
ncbi:MAG: HAMP domain-containing histidine kinase, partial [Bacteroidetes bacterium]|nr:HAMP domain-containing histidine kinase [Bacteroidota bacterium]